MPRYNLQIHQVHIVDGFVDDCDELLHRCRQVDPLTYDIFTEIWKDMGFANLYSNRTTHVEVAEMSEEFLHIAKRYMVANTSNYEDSVMGLFVVYALLKLQPYPGFAPLRITPDDVPSIARIESVARREKRFDVLRILGSVLIEGPCHYTIVDRPRGLEVGFRKYFEGYTGMGSEGIRPKGVFYRQNVELDLIREMFTLDKRYSDAKKYITGDKPDACLNYTEKNLPQKLESSLKSVISGLFGAEETVQQTEGSSKESEEPDERYNLVQQIKTKAMKGTVNEMNHLRGVKERHHTIVFHERSPKGQSKEINKKGGSVKSSSPKKPVISDSPKKRKRPITVSPNKKRLKKRYKDEGDSEMSSLPSCDDDIDPITDEEENLRSPHNSNELQNIGENNGSSDSVEKEQDSEKKLEINNICLESLPILFGDNEYIEIEVIDEVNPSEIATKSTTDTNTKNISQSEIVTPDLVKTQTVQDPQNEKILKKINESPHLSIEMVPLNDDIATHSQTNMHLNTPKNDDDLFKKPKSVTKSVSITKPIINKKNKKKSKPKRRIGFSATNMD